MWTQKEIKNNLVLFEYIRLFKCFQNLWCILYVSGFVAQKLDILLDDKKEITIKNFHVIEEN